MDDGVGARDDGLMSDVAFARRVCSGLRVRVLLFSREGKFGVNVGTALSYLNLSLCRLL